MSGTNEVLGGGGLHHVAMRAKDFDASVRFYTEALGFKEAVRWGEADQRAVLLDTGDGRPEYLPVLAQVRIAFFKGPDGELIELFHVRKGR